MPSNSVSKSLTIVIPTHNRPALCAALLRMHRECGVTYRIIVADSSSPANAGAVRQACEGKADYFHFSAVMSIADKFREVLGKVETPYVVFMPDDDVTFPHAVDAAVQALIDDPSAAAAHGYVLNFGIHESNFDIHSVYSFTPSIMDEDPLARMYELMRRYQPFIWAVFRTEVFAASIKLSSEVDGLIFQEIGFMNSAILQGKVIRLPMVYAMRGPDESLSARSRIDPFAWVLEDAAGFFDGYGAYRNRLVKEIEPRSMKGKRASAEQLLDVIHGTYLGREVDVGKLNHTARYMLGDNIAPIAYGAVWPGWRAVAASDLMHKSSGRQRHYIWRQGVVEAAPKSEISITADEMTRVEAQLEFYR